MRNLFLLFFILFTSSLWSEEHFYFSNLSLGDGLSQITVTSIHQDRNGFMWFGTRNGLNRYDGYNFDVFLTTLNNPATISDNHILCITEDKEGNLWIGTNNGLNYLNLNTYEFKRYFSDPEDDKSLSHNSIYSLYYDDRQNLWIGTENGLDRFDTKSEMFEHVAFGELMRENRVNAIVGKYDKLYIGTQKEGLIIYNMQTEAHEVYTDFSDSPDDSNSLYVKTLLIDQKDNLWIGTHHSGVCLLKKGETKPFRYNQKNGLTNDNIRMITEDPNGNIIVATFNGLTIINSNTNELSQYKDYGSNQGGLSHYSVTSLFYDSSQTLWVGTYAGGICYYNKYGQKFRFYDMDMGRKKILGIIGPIIETPTSLYIATEGGGLLEMDKKTNSYRSYDLLSVSRESYEYNIIKALCLDEDRILCGTNLGTIYSFDLKSKKFTLFYDLKEQRSVYLLRRNTNGQLIIGGVGRRGFSLLSPDGRLINTFPVKGGKDFFFSDVRCALEIEKNVYVIGTRNDGLYYYDYNTHALKHYKNDKVREDSGQIPENYVTDIIKDSRNEIWIGTYGGGIGRFDVKTGKFISYNTQHDLLNNNVCKIVEDNDRHLWVSTITGISDFDPQNEQFNNYTHHNGIRINEFTLHAGLKLSDGRIVYSGNNGFISFDPHKMSVNPFVPPIVINNLYVNNHLLKSFGSMDALCEHPSEQKEIVLKYDQSNVSIEYSALNYIFSYRNQYLYKLKGFDKDWIPAGNRRMAYYTNIPPGTYQFIVRGSNNDGIWNNVGASIMIKILPPYWKTWWAYTLYIFTFGAIVWFVIFYFYEKKRLKDNIRMKQLENKTREAFHQERNKLFTNFSHELRTPLTLIISPLEDIDATENLSVKGKENIRLMHNNAKRLLRIVNNLMDFQKKESGTMKLKICESDFMQFTCEMVLLFKELAASRKIDFTFRYTPDFVRCWFDKGLMEKVYFNFLSNAFKNVPDGGSIEININIKSFDELNAQYPQKASFYSDNQILYLVLEIKDSGKGIAEDELENIFIPFYQVAQNEHSSSGTGLGLSLSKSIIEMHHGVVWAESPEGCGAIFKFILPVSKADFEVVEFDDEAEMTPVAMHSIEISNTSPRELPDADKVYSILVVEDNKDVRNYIISHLKDFYRIIEAYNGVEGVEKTLNYYPDLIITDLMMPKMDGMEMCSIIKKDIRVSHIPVIIITARTMVVDITEGFKAGADDYITKPFSSSVLMARVENILKSRDNLKKLYGRNFSLETLGVKAVSLDEQFMQKLYQTMETHLSNPDLNLNQFAKEIGMSRANLYRKIKSITNLSPNEFIRNFRLNMGAKMLKETQMSVSDIYVVVGFNSHGYFSNCFKAHFGISPTEFAKLHSDYKANNGSA